MLCSPRRPWIAALLALSVVLAAERARAQDAPPPPEPAPPPAQTAPVVEPAPPAQPVPVVQPGPFIAPVGPAPYLQPAPYWPPQGYAYVPPAPDTERRGPMNWYGWQTLLAVAPFDITMFTSLAYLGQPGGNAAFAAYNLREPLQPVRFLLALGRRLYYVFIGSGHFIGTLAVLWALRRMPLLRDRPWRIAGSFVLAQLLVVSALGGAVLERYVLPTLPVVYVAFAVSLRALPPRKRQLTLAALVACLVAANFVNPIYPFPFENNLAFVSFVGLEGSAATVVEEHAAALPGGGSVATAFPMANALRNPDFGFVRSPRKVVEITDFSRPEIEKLKTQAPDMVVVYRRAWDPLHLLDHPAVSGFLARQYGYEPEMGASQIAQTLSMRVARRWRRRGLSMELLER